MAQEPWPVSQPIVSVVIPCYNYGAYLPAAVDSVVSQTLQDREIIVVDDGSTDPQTLAVLQGLERPRTELIRQRNLGVSSARNAGVGVARGKYIRCLDADDTLESTYLEKAVVLMECRPDIGFAYPWTRRFGLGSGFWLSEDFDLRKLITANLLTHPAVFRREAWGSVGGYWEDLRAGHQDWEFWIHIASAGYRGAVIPEILFNYRKHGPSAIDRAVERRDTIVSKIRSRHARLYSDPTAVLAIESGYQDRLSDTPLLNLSRPEQYVAASARPAGVLLTDSADLLESEHAQEWGLCLAPPPAPQDGPATLRTAFPYYLPTFLPPQHYAQFITNFLDTRSPDRLLMSDSILSSGIVPSEAVEEWLAGLQGRVEILA
jgi:GT2 family glycosyltransferase